MKARSVNVDPAELEKFEAMAAQWWDPEGDFRPLHDLNPVRTRYITDAIEIDGARIVDVGCGAGLMSEALAAGGGEVVGIDLAEGPLKVARLHRHESELEVDYRLISAEELADDLPESFDLAVCLEMLEHVPDPASVIDACARLVKPGGYCVFSTLNRTPKAFALAIAGAEYLLGLLPRGTHEYAKFIRPSELARAARQAGLEMEDVSGLHYEPFRRRAWLAEDVAVNYLARFRKPV
jgi:2-polyprenyl-6-hydroxyphenyl methylase/3-demethylubiquinone-9 3-methyltransferase